MHHELMIGGHIQAGRKLQSPSLSPPPPPHLRTRLDNIELVSFLRRKSAGESIRHTFIHEKSAYDGAPADLVLGLAHAPITDPSKRIAWYFICRMSFHRSAGGGSRRKRQVGAGETFWHPETGKKPIFGPDKKPLRAYERTLSYVSKIRNLPEAGAGKPFKNNRLGWCMVEIGLELQQDDDNQLVICKLYRTNRKHAETSMEARSTGAEAPWVYQLPVSGDDDGMHVQAAGGHGGISEDNNGGHQGHAEAGEEGRASLDGAEPGNLCRLGGENQNPSRTRELGSRNAAGAATLKEGEATRGLTVTVVMKLAESSIQSPDRMKEIAKLVLVFLDRAGCGESPVVVLSAMGDTTANILLAADKAATCGEQKVCEINELKIINELHLTTVDKLGLPRSTISGLLNQLESTLQYVAKDKELTPTERCRLVSLGESMSTTIFSAYLNGLGIKSRKYDARDFAIITTENSSNADILTQNYTAVAKKLQGDWIDSPAIPIVTSFVGEGHKSGGITILGSDLTAMIVGKALGSKEIQIWEHFDGILTGDPNIFTNAIPVPTLTFDEATELACSGHQGFHPQSMQLAVKADIPIITVKNSYHPDAPGTTITQTRDMSKSILSSIVLKSNIFMLNIVSTGLLSQREFQAQVFSIFKDLRISVDHEANSGCNISLTLDLSNLSQPQLIQKKLDIVIEELEEVATVVQQHTSIISLVGNGQKSSFILGKAFDALDRIGVNVQKVSQRSSKVLNVSLVVHPSEAKRCVQVLHSTFLEAGCFLSKVEGAENKERTSPVNSSIAAASSGDKRKLDDDDHPHARPAVVQRMNTDHSRLVEETERTAFSDKAGTRPSYLKTMTTLVYLTFCLSSSSSSR